MLTGRQAPARFALGGSRVLPGRDGAEIDPKNSSGEFSLVRSHDDDVAEAKLPGLLRDDQERYASLGLGRDRDRFVLVAGHGSYLRSSMTSGREA